MNEWKQLTLAEIISTVIDYRGKTPKKLGSDGVRKDLELFLPKILKQGKSYRMKVLDL